MASVYRQLCLEERVVLQTQLSLGLSPAAIAAGLKRARWTITREMARNGWKRASEATAQSRRWGNGMYLARTADLRAHRLHQKSRVERKLVPGTPLWQFILSQMRRHLSPAQIASTLARMPTPVRISHETFYATFYAMPRGELRAQVLKLLRRHRPQRGARSPERHQRAFLDAMTLIDHRPEEVDQRIVPGHWEGDLIKGAMNRSRVGTLVERTTLFVALVKLEDGRAETVANGFAAILNRFQSPCVSPSPMTREEKWPATNPSPSRPESRSTSPIPTARGSEASTKTPTACCASTSPKAKTSAPSLNNNSIKSPWK